MNAGLVRTDDGNLASPGIGVMAGWQIGQAAIEFRAAGWIVGCGVQASTIVPARIPGRVPGFQILAVSAPAAC